jgi:hypothetical protein
MRRLRAAGVGTRARLRFGIRWGMAKSWLWRATGSLVVTMLVGCGGSDDVSSFVGKFCDIYRPCCMAAGLRADGQQCRAFYGTFASGSHYDATAGEACLNATRARAGQTGFCEGTLPDPPECNRVFAAGGTKPPGATCTDDDECAPSDEGDVECNSAFAPSGEIRKCQVVIRGASGSNPCVRTVNGSVFFSNNADDVVPRGYACYVSDGVRCDDVSMSCVALTAIGQRCSGFDDCVSGAYCDFTSGTCMMRKPVGMACTGSTSSECVDTAYCRARTTCTARQATGTSCTENAQCTSDSCVNMSCEAGGNFLLSFICGQP